MIIVSHLLYYEEPYLDEWINFHRRQGFKTFYIYLKYGKLTHGSIIPKDDKVYERLVQKYHRYNVTFIHIESIPIIHINNFFRHHAIKYLNQWCAILDIDEFLHCPVKDLTVKKMTKYYDRKKINAVLINWHCYGSNGIINNPTYETVNKFTKPTNKFIEMNCYCKSFIKITKQLLNSYEDNKNVHRIMTIKKYYTSNGTPLIEHNTKNYDKCINLKRKFLKEYHGINRNNLHFSINHMFAYPEKNPKLIINHYITRSLEEYKKKIALNKTKQDRYNLKFFNYVNRL